MSNPWEFLRGANPDALAALLREEGPLVAGAVVAHLSLPEATKALSRVDATKRSAILDAARKAKTAPPVLLNGVAEAVKAKLRSAKTPSSANPATNARPSPSDARLSPAVAGKPAATRTPPPGVINPKPPPAKLSAPQPWKPRQADREPINPSTNRASSPDPLSRPAAAKLEELLAQARKKLAGENPQKAAGFIPAGSVPVDRAKARVPGPLSAKPAPPRSPAPIVAGARRFDGQAVMAAILREAGADVRDVIRAADPKLFEALKSRMFIFDDLERSGADALGAVFTAAEVKDVVLSLWFSSPRLRERVLASVGSGRAAMLAGELKRPMRGISISSVEAAQERVLKVALRLQSLGKILIDPDDPDLAH